MAVMQAERPAAPVPPRPSLTNLRESVKECRACDLWEAATQAVMGEGPRHAELMLVGETPGDREDLEGHPFVGPAGGVLDRGLERAGITRGDVYLTNAVKHFRYKLRGKRRIHQTPDRWQVNACLPWVRAEIKVVRPVALVCLGAVAGQALLGPQVRIGRDRGQRFESDLAEFVTLTTHPSAILRTDDDEREQAMDQFVTDLSEVAKWLSAR
ncbi:MAG TPA: UdgX family uracil-DNA binding protein [Solirubrobacteraceae bacterium]|nr:UdgX family uracil-DNA binding protein [Solirubrobacteraceae bacterium]